jgi:hypothetical protein
MTGWVLPSFRGKRNTFSPKWANAAELGDSRHIYVEMYRHLAADGDISPEGLVVIPDYNSPNGKFLLVVSYDVRGTTVIFEIEPQAP